MSKERLIIPTPAGPRKVYCPKCDKGIAIKPDETVYYSHKYSPVYCLGCPGAFNKHGCFGVSCTPRRERIYEHCTALCDKCRENLVIHKNKEDEQ